MSVSVKLDLLEIEKVLSDLDGMIDRATALRPAMEVGAAEITKLISNSFRYSRSPDDTPWLRLKKSTVERRRGGSNKPLVDTGILQAGSYAYAENDYIVYGSRPIYAAAQNFGSEKPRAYVDNAKNRRLDRVGQEYTRKIPARPFLPYDKDTDAFMVTGSAGRALRKIAAYILEYIARAKRASGDGEAL